MATAVAMPALSPTMAEGKITKWLKKVGDKVGPGTAIAECETDKSNLEIESFEEGVLLKILVKEGEAAAVGAPIAYVGKAGEKVDDVPAAAPAPAPAAAAPKAATSAPAAITAPMPAVAPPPRATAPRAAAAAPSNGSNGRLRVSPLARRIASETGVDLAGVHGSGPQGRIVKRDVEEAAKVPAGARAQLPKTIIMRTPAGVRPPPDSVPLTTMRKVIAQRLTEVKPGVPHFYLTVDLEMDQALKLREEAKATGGKISVNDIVVKAVAVALRRFPRINQIFAGDHIEQLHTVDVGVAVAIEDGLITPIIRDADQKGLEEIGAEVRDLAERAKKRSLKPEEYTGGSITVSNLGMFGIDSFIAVLNPPQAAIIAVGVVTPKPVVRDGQMVIRNMMSATLSGDHRVIDGAVGAQYLQELRGLLEHPLRLLL
jgi:pyruvate dehydrogenase E2 component (dihydrolipoamide acetyltransferase)